MRCVKENSSRQMRALESAVKDGKASPEYFLKLASLLRRVRKGSEAIDSLPGPVLDSPDARSDPIRGLRRLRFTCIYPRHYLPTSMGVPLGAWLGIMSGFDPPVTLDLPRCIRHGSGGCSGCTEWTADQGGTCRFGSRARRKAR